jgi:hypothetical protein
MPLVVEDGKLRRGELEPEKAVVLFMPVYVHLFCVGLRPATLCYGFLLM